MGSYGKALYGSNLPPAYRAAERLVQDRGFKCTGASMEGGDLSTAESGWYRNGLLIRLYGEAHSVEG